MHLCLSLYLLCGKVGEEVSQPGTCTKGNVRKPRKGMPSGSRCVRRKSWCAGSRVAEEVGFRFQEQPYRESSFQAVGLSFRFQELLSHFPFPYKLLESLAKCPELSQQCYEESQERLLSTLHIGKRMWTAENYSLQSSLNMENVPFWGTTQKLGLQSQRT